MPGTATDPFIAYSNYAEAALWWLVALLLFVAAARSPKWRRHTALTGVALLAFGASDIVEAQTGAWWDPWWLLLWKSAGVIALTISAVAYYIRKRREQAQVPEHE